MKRPIDPADIRKGDLIRCERKATAAHGEGAHEFRATIAQDNDGWAQNKFDWFLLDRPEPAVELPTEPTLGWLGWKRLGVANAGELRIWSAGMLSSETEVKSWTPATAVPTAALDELRATLPNTRELPDGADWVELTRIVSKFLAAVDEVS